MSGDAADGGVLAIEIGGTTIRAGIVDTASGTVLRRNAVATPRSAGAALPSRAAHLTSAIAAAADGMVDGVDPTTVAVAFPGPVDDRGIALAVPTVFGGTEPFPVADACTAMWPESRVVVVNDVTAAGYRYVAAGLTDFCVLTVGSGVGHKVFVGGRPVLGPGGRGGEIGHLRVDHARDAVRCDCGGRGHVGAIASGRGALELYRRRRAMSGRAADVTSEALADAFHAGDDEAEHVVLVAAQVLAHAIAAIHLAVGAETFVVGGGWAAALGERYRRMIARSAASAAWDLGHDWDAMIRLGFGDDDSGLVGSALLAAGAFPC